MKKCFSNPKVSLIIPFLNCRRFFKETIESVFAQTFKDWELILVDDGSTDGSKGIALDYAGKYPEKITYLCHDENKNKGACISRNLGFKKSKGELVLFLDHDDVLLPQNLERKILILESNPEAGATFDETFFWFGWTENPKDQLSDYIWAPWKHYGIAPDTVVLPPRFLNPLIQNSVFPITSTLLIRRHVFNLIGGWPEDALDVFDDRALCFKLFMHFPVYVSSGWLVKYRQHEDSWVHVAEKECKVFSSHILYYKWAEDYMASQDFHDKEIEEHINKKLKPYRHPIHEEQIIPPLSFMGEKQFGDLHRLLPLNREYGRDRNMSVQPGTPINDHYFEIFLNRHAKDITGHVMENGTAGYAQHFGGNSVIKADILLDDSQVGITTCDDNGPDTERNYAKAMYDCLIFDRFFSFSYDIQSAIVRTCEMLKPGGVLLATLPGICQMHRCAGDQQIDYWRFTEASARRLFGDVFGNKNVIVETYGNVLAAGALLFGLASHELKEEELDYNDPDYQIVIAVRAVKSAIS